MRKAAIGPIGDDIPSIFPIVAAVLMFIGASIFVSQQLAARNDYLELKKAGAGLGYVATSKTYLPDGVFASECALTYREYAARQRVNFLVTVKKFCHYVDLSSDIFSVKSSYPPHSQIDSAKELSVAHASVPGESYHHVGLSCLGGSGACNANGACDSGESTASCPLDCRPKNFQSFNFPVTVNCHPARPLVGLGMLNVIVWRDEK